MMRLIDDLAARRLYYSRPLPTLPDVLLIDAPAVYAGSGLGLGRYYPIVIETIAEAHELESFLCAERPLPVPPDILDRRPSALRSAEIIVARYAPPEPVWPCLLLCAWPPDHVAMVEYPQDQFARGAYTVDLFQSWDEVDAFERRLLANLNPAGARHLRMGPDHHGSA